VSYLVQETDNHHGERVKSIITKTQDGGGRHIRLQKMSISPDWMKMVSSNLLGRCISSYGDDRRYRYSDDIVNNCKMAFSLHLLDRLSDEYNYWQWLCMLWTVVYTRQVVRSVIVV